KQRNDSLERRVHLFTRNGIDEVDSLLHLKACDFQVHLRVFGQDLGRFLRVFQGPKARPFVEAEHALDDVRVLLEETFQNVQAAVGVNAGVAVEQYAASSQVGVSHRGIEAGPCVHVAPLQRDAALGMRYVDDGDVTGGQAVRFQSSQGEEPGI